MEEWTPITDCDSLEDKEAIFLEKETRHELIGKVVYVRYYEPKDYRVHIGDYLYYIDNFSHYKLI